MIKKAIVMLAIVAAFEMHGAERISVDAVITHYPWDGKVDCVCTLGGLEDVGYLYRGAFTLTATKAGVRVIRTVTNAFAEVDGTYTNTFDFAALFGEGVYADGNVAVDLVKGEDHTGAPIGISGDVLVINVAGGSEAASYPTRELSGVDLGTFNCDVYKTDRIALRKVPAGTYYCQPQKGNSNPHVVVTQKLETAGFYIGVFPITQRQYERVMGVNPSWPKTNVLDNIAEQRPAEIVTWNKLRGEGAYPGDPITEESADSFLRRMVVRTGLPGFDLPTEAQWEMSCRAGATAEYGAYWDGTAAVELTASNLGEAAWYLDNSSRIAHAVGGKRPNLWGLYDMQGNVWEFCRDIYTDTFRGGSHVDTVESYLGRDWVARVVRGGGWRFHEICCRPSHRDDVTPDYSNDCQGFRLMKALPESR